MTGDYLVTILWWTDDDPEKFSDNIWQQLTTPTGDFMAKIEKCLSCWAQFMSKKCVPFEKCHCTQRKCSFYKLPHVSDFLLVDSYKFWWNLMDIKTAHHDGPRAHTHSGDFPTFRESLEFFLILFLKFRLEALSRSQNSSQLYYLSNLLFSLLKKLSNAVYRLANLYNTLHYFYPCKCGIVHSHG